MNKGKLIIAQTWATLFYIACAVCVGMGFYKMYEYENSDFEEYRVNAYVGGDAYNYIINSNYAGDFFILAVLCALIGSTILIAALLKIKIDAVHESKESQE